MHNRKKSYLKLYKNRTSLVALAVKNLPATWETQLWPLDWEDPLEKGTATLSDILAWRIPWTVWSMGLQRVGHDWATFTFRKHKYHYLKILKADYFDNCIVSGWSSLWFYLFLFCEVWKNTEQGFIGFTRESKMFMAYERPRAPEFNLICRSLPYSGLHEHERIKLWHTLRDIHFPVFFPKPTQSI